MARPILCSQEDLNAVEMQDVTSEGHNTLAQDVRDAGPPKRITTENDNNNAKVAAQAEEKGGDDDDDDDDSDDDDNDNDTEEEEREEGESEDSDLESSDGLYWMCSCGSRDFSSILEEDSISYDNGYYSDASSWCTYIDYPDSQDLWQTEDNRENDYGFV